MARLRGIIIGVALALIAGCSLIGNAAKPAAVGIQTAIEYATAAYIQKAGTDTASQLARAKQVKAVAGELQALNMGTVTVAQLQTVLAGNVTNLSVPNQIAANGLIELIGQQIQVQQSTGVLNAANQAAVNTVLGYVLTVCGMYGA